MLLCVGKAYKIKSRHVLITGEIRPGEYSCVEMTRDGRVEEDETISAPLESEACELSVEPAGALFERYRKFIREELSFLAKKQGKLFRCEPKSVCKAGDLQYRLFPLMMDDGVFPEYLADSSQDEMGDLIEDFYVSRHCRQR